MTARNRQPGDYYGILAVNPDASADDIRRAYRRLALEWHPDRNPGNSASTQKFQELSEAYAVLSDPSKRQEYDEFRRIGTGDTFGYSREDLFRDMFASKSASAIFEEIAREFERMGMRVDRHYFEQTLFGGRAFVAGGVFIISPLTPLIGAFRLARIALRGLGAASGLAARQVEQIPGVGSTVSSLGRLGRWLLGIPAEPVEAQSVAVPGDLTLPLRLTSEEGAEGVRKKISVPRDGKMEELLVLVPRGVSHGTRLRLRGKGNSGPKGPAGDLYLRIEIAGAESRQG